jgi:hypothetical protein
MRCRRRGALVHAAAWPLRRLTLSSVKRGPVVWPATLAKMQAACRFGLGAYAVASVLVIGDAVRRKLWFVATMSCRRATERTRR